MAFEVSATFDAKDIFKKLGELDAKVQKKVIRKAVTSGSQAMVKIARNIVPVRKTHDVVKRLVGPNIKFREKTVKVFKKQFAKEDVFDKSIESTTGYAGGQLKKSLGYKVKAYPASGVIVGIIGPRRGYRIQIGTRTRGKNKGKPVYVNPVNYAHLIELGTRHSPPYAFLRNAIEGGRKDMMSMLTFGIERAIEEVARGA